MNEEGLAAQQIMPQQQQQQQQLPANAINEIIALLKQGITPEQLLQQGVPQELIQAAIEMITQETAAVPTEGLAGSVLK